jgi:hypothetical protein
MYYSALLFPTPLNPEDSRWAPQVSHPPRGARVDWALGLGMTDDDLLPCNLMGYYDAVTPSSPMMAYEIVRTVCLKAHECSRVGGRAQNACNWLSSHLHKTRPAQGSDPVDYCQLCGEGVSFLSAASRREVEQKLGTLKPVVYKKRKIASAMEVVKPDLPLGHKKDCQRDGADKT